MSLHAGATGRCWNCGGRSSVYVYGYANGRDSCLDPQALKGEWCEKCDDAMFGPKEAQA